MTRLRGYDIHNLVMTNVMTTNEMTSAAPAASASAVASDEAFALVEFQFNAANGEPEGCEFAESFEEAAVMWGYCLTPGDIRMMQVWQRSEEKWFRIERTRDGVEVRETTV